MQEAFAPCTLLQLRNAACADGCDLYVLASLCFASFSLPWPLPDVLLMVSHFGLGVVRAATGSLPLPLPGC
jgi:hypothetical protein